jgi:flagellar hook-associated protein 1 FlgK
VNTILSEIASLNKAIATGKTGTTEANDYVDQRAVLLKELSGYMDVSYYTSDNGMVNVSTSGGACLVNGTLSYSLRKIANEETGLIDIGLVTASGDIQDITSQISGGSVGALLTIMNSTVPSYASDLDALAQSITKTVNYFHEQGNDDAGISYFDEPASDYALNMRLSYSVEDASGDIDTANVMTSSSTSETSGNDVAARIASLADETLLGGTTLTGKTVSSAGTALGLSGNLVINGVQVAVGPTDTLSGIAARINAATSSTGVTASVKSTSSGYRLALASTTGESISVVNGTLDTSSSASSLLQSLTSTAVSSTTTALGVSGTFIIGSQSFTVTAGSTLQSVISDINSYSGTVVASATGNATDGYSLLLTDSGTGATITVSGSITQALGLTGESYAGYEASVVSRIGQQVSTATDLAAYHESSIRSLEAQEAAESGVSIDTEISNLIKYQSAYQAASRIYTTAQEMFKTLLSMMGVAS